MKISISMIHILLAFSFLISSCSPSGTKNNNAKADSAIDSSKVLVVYLSRTNNTKAIAEIINKNVGGKLVTLELEKPYPENYQATVQQVVKENETGYLPIELPSSMDAVRNQKEDVPHDSKDPLYKFGYGLNY